MRKLLQSLLRITVGAAAIAIGLLVGFAWVVRQPNTGQLGFPGARRANAAALEAHVRYLAVSDPARAWGNRAGLDRAGAYISQGFSATRARVTEQPYRAWSLDARNICATFGPDHGPRVVVGAHYDVFGDLPGADDNASGVAALLELARLLDEADLSSPVELVAYSTEEPPFFGGAEMGSAVHARSLLRDNSPVRAMIAIEMIGYFSPKQPNQVWLLHLIYPRKGSFVSVVGRWSDRHLIRRAKKAFRGATEVPVVSYTGPVAVGADLSDHSSYWLAGFPAIMVTDTAYLRNPHYHTPNDTPDTLDYQAMAGVVDGVFSTVIHLAKD